MTKRHTMTHTIAHCTLLCVAMFFSITFITHAANTPPQGNPSGEPPQEAFSACGGKQQNDTCSFTGARNETVAGYCITIPENRLVCSPNTDPVAASAEAPSDATTNETTTTPQPEADEPALDSASMVPESQLTFWQKLFNFFFGWLIKDEVTSQSPVTPTNETEDTADTAKSADTADTASPSTDDSTAKPGMADPSALYCEEQGGSYKLQGGRCNLNGVECSSWDFFRTKTCTDDNTTSTDDTNNTSSDTSDTETEPATSVSGSWTIPDTGQTKCYNNTGTISCPSSGKDFYGQDGNYSTSQMSYTNNGDGTVTDNVTGLMWIKDAGDKVSYTSGVNSADSFTYAGYSDWRVPTIKELYSLIDFSGSEPSVGANSGNNPFIDDTAFVFEYGDTSKGDRAIDSQWITDTINVSTVMHGSECFFGVNFADGRIKCYETNPRMNTNGFFIRLVRGNTGYGENHFTDNGNGTVTDSSSGLTWQQNDSGKGLDWADALAYCEDLTLGGKSDWRLPNAHELQYIVDYTRSPDTSNSAAIDPIFSATSITNEGGEKDWAYYWTGTTHGNDITGTKEAVYVSFGRGYGNFMNENMDVHGAGAQRSDPKSGNASDYPNSFGPQGDWQRVYNYVRCVR